ncbi:hypothetical protein [Shumkonia mesophila]|uniref:hypothetical protein n=1 Tax=Shumkonia mesophila TaxID=2838854 RepID=UPI0029347108|nr:hypothetical protein [Shumkonia mesophila]
MVRVMRVLFVEAPILGALVLAAIGFAVGLVLRYEWIEPVAIGILCDESAKAPLWCGPRTALVVSAQSLPGRAVVVGLAFLLWLVRNETAARNFGFAILFLAGMGLIFYNTGAAVVAFCVAGLRLVRLEKAPPQP